MNLSPTTPRNSFLLRAFLLGTAFVGLYALCTPPRAIAAGKSKGIDVEIPYEANVLKASVVAPQYLNEASGGMVVSDASGGLYSVTLIGTTTALEGKSKLKHPGGVASAPARFGTAGQLYVLSSGYDAADRARSIRSTSRGRFDFAKLFDAGGASHRLPRLRIRCGRDSIASKRTRHRG